MNRLNLIKSKEYWIEILENAKYNKLSNESVAENIVDKINEALILPVVVRQSEQLKAFAEYIQERMWEDDEKDLSEFVDDFLSL